jgi:hypothetical protein
MSTKGLLARLERAGRGSAEAQRLGREINALLDELAALGPDAVTETLAALGLDPTHPKEEA